jgi:hypothetical protein
MGQGSSSCTVYVTSGDASESRGWALRETGILAAQADMAGVSSNWSCAFATYLGHTVQRCELSPLPRITAIFLRLHDGAIETLWGMPLVNNPVASLATIADSMLATSYTRAELIAVLTEIMRQSGAGHVLTMDSTLAYGSQFYDHHDHIACGFFALMAAQAYGHVDGVRIYRGYTSQFDPTITLAQGQIDRKDQLMVTYGAGGCIAPYNLWCPHQVSYASVLGTGQLRLPGGSCLESQGSVRLAPCSGSPTQTWTVGADGTIITGTRCLAATGTSLVAGNCDGSPEQTWTWFDNRQLRGTGATCLMGSGTTASLATCDGQGGATPPGSPGPALTQQWVP